MVTGAEALQAENFARQALERLKRGALPPIPENFSVYFHYYAGTNPNLRMAVDLLTAQGGGLSQEQCMDLYRSHLGLEAEHKVLQETNAAVEKEIKHVLALIDSTSSGTTEYTKTLDSFSGKLGSGIPVDQVREMVQKVAAETQAMAKQNERLQNQLAVATQELTEMRYNLEVVHKESQIDPLTEVGNRKFFNKELGRAMVEARESLAPLTILMIDIDHFKKFNDSYGHLIGDQVLRLVARTLVENLKGRDVIARYGGEEFVILLPSTPVSNAERVGNQLRASLSTKQIKRRSTNETLGVITISIGATEYNVTEDAESFVARADAALYKAKQSGRNCVVTELAPMSKNSTAKA